MIPDSDFDDASTLDPPGTIVVLGTTAVGIEAALYGRYLGYNVRLIAGVDTWTSQRPDAGTPSGRIGPTLNDDWFARHWLGDHSIASRWDDSTPMLPAQSLSPLAIEAITAQQEGVATILPVSMRQWVEDGLRAVLETDLLSGRCFLNTFVDSIELAEVIDDEASGGESPGDDEDIPPDFLLTLSGESLGERESHQLQCECILVADVSIDSVQLDFELPADYFYQITSTDQPNAADELRAGWQQIAKIYARLAGRSELDLYRPRRL